ncbi:GNAT family N-acetyltransferase [Actinokineospora bangkokensis]|uniref:N-acetyltransferase domain-containing protein n=1 Tax=Actinokineospora bangkokensis TaxID=1193682 RepID=A0A1Q9LJN1_9PSEU|nr:GNAT family N-acetyltransferase [Actinokineospora bangkokensis]OLR92220.1 hypothetical protein BJP25_23140 [Actinokineospora bangkokensis]
MSTADVRRLTLDDLGACLDLTADRDWARDERKWRLLFRVGHVVGVDAPGGGLAAVAVGSRYGERATAVGMVLVARAHERRGLGRRVVEHVLAGSGTPTAWLTATEMGRPLYESMGFRTVDHLSTYTGVPTGVAKSGVSRACTGADLDDVAALDRAAFGAPRSALVAALPGFCDDLRVVDGPGGYGGTWPSTGVTVLGPVVAATPEIGVGLLSDLAAGTTGVVRLDVGDHRPEVHAWARAHGLELRLTSDVMLLGPDLPPGPARTTTAAMQALG